MTKEHNLKFIQNEFHELLASLKTVTLSTRDHKNQPEASYAPYVEFDSAYYLFISGLAKHTVNLKQNGFVSLLFIEDEANCRNLFSRRRVILAGKGIIIDRNSSHYSLVMAQFRHRFGRFIDIIEPLQDFSLFQINVLEGRYIRGFAQAFELTGTDLKEIAHIVPKSL